MFELVFSKRANETFDSIQDQILNKWGEHSLKKFDERIYEVLQLLAKSPFIYEAVAEYPTVRKAIVHKNCALYYKVSKERVILLFFWDNRQDPIF